MPVVCQETSNTLGCAEMRLAAGSRLSVPRLCADASGRRIPVPWLCADAPAAKSHLSVPWLWADPSGNHVQRVGPAAAIGIPEFCVMKLRFWLQHLHALAHHESCTAFPNERPHFRPALMRKHTIPPLIKKPNRNERQWPWFRDSHTSIIHEHAFSFTASEKFCRDRHVSIFVQASLCRRI